MKRFAYSSATGEEEQGDQSAKPLAQNLGLAALTKGKTVLFPSLAWALADLLKQESQSRL